jgi:ketosteroid isomerase-like protein
MIKTPANVPAGSFDATTSRRNETIVSDATQVVDRFIRGLEAGDLEAVVACYTQDARIWHNFDEIVMTPRENAETLKTFFDEFPVREYREVRRAALPDGGLLQQHVLRMVRKDGRSIDWPGCIVLKLNGQQIQQLEEYVDFSSFVQRMA